MRHLILKAAVEEMNAHGVKFTMSDLARRLAVSKRTLYEYFASKKELIGAITDEILTRLRQERMEILNNERLTFYEKLSLYHVIRPNPLGFIDEHRLIDEVRRYFPEEWNKFQQFQEMDWQAFEALLRQGIAEGYLRPVNLAVVQKMIAGAVNEMLTIKFFVENNLTLNEAMTNLMDIIVHGLMAPAKVIA